VGFALGEWRALGLAASDLGESLTHPLCLSLQLLEILFKLGSPLFSIAEPPMQAVGMLCRATAAGVITSAATTPTVARAGTMAATAVAAVAVRGRQAPVVAFMSAAAAAVS
jgi:hypothetical protein